MIKMKKHWNLLTIMMVTSICVVLTSCSDDENDSSGLKGWYTNLNVAPNQSDFYKLNTAISNKEVLSSYRHSSYVASRDLFIGSDGRYDDTDAYFGRLRFSIQNPINAIRIVDDTTLLFYVAWLYEEGAGSGDEVYKFYAGSIFGSLAYYGTPTYYTYSRVDNKIVTTNGDIFTVVDGGLIKDGSSVRWSKYDPTKKY